MKNYIVLCVGIMLMTSLFYCDAQTQKPKHSIADIRKMLADKRQAKLVQSGGIVAIVPEGKVIEIVNNQDTVPVNMIEEIAARIARMTRLPIVVVKAKSNNAGIFLELVHDQSTPALISAIDDGWAKTNLKKLTADNPNDAKLKNRLEKWLWRAVGASMGIGVSPLQPSIMRNIDRIGELDAISMMQPEPLMQNCFSSVPSHFGVENIKISSYRKACEEGWAPAPTNDIQKAIWDKVHAIPDKPMQIKFDPAAQKGKVTK